MPGPAALSPGQHLPGGRQMALLVEAEGKIHPNPKQLSQGAGVPVWPRRASPT